MISIKNTLISEDLMEKSFVCDLNACKGACCVEGDGGAPLDEEECDILDEIYDKIEVYLRPEGIQAIKEQGRYLRDHDGDLVTPLVNDAECAYVIFEENGMTKCGIEQAYIDGVIDYKKPISCHMYPVRVDSYPSFDAVNYHKWSICSDACTLGEKLQVPVFRFLKEALVRKYGEKWYEEVEEVYEALHKQ